MARVSPSEFTDTLIRRQVLIQRLSEGERAKFLPFLKEIDGTIRKRLATDELTSFSRARLEKILGRVDELLGEILGQFQADLFSGINEIVANEAKFTKAALESAVHVDIDLPSVPQLRLAVLTNPLSIKSGSLLKPFVRDWTAGERKSVVGAIRRGVFEGKSNAEIVRDIRGTRARRYSDGLLEVTARNAAAVVHTAVGHMAAQARQETIAANADIVAKVRWISTLDRKTCFVAGTPVDTPTGPVAIEQLAPGDTVIGGSLKPRAVLATIHKRSANLVRVRLSNGETVICTADHRWLTTRGWQEAGALEVGERLKNKL